VEITVRAPEGAAASKAGSPPQPAAGAK
jgi:hypothetical protein